MEGSINQPKNEPSLSEIAYSQRLEQAGDNPDAIELVRIRREIAENETFLVNFAKDHPKDEPGTKETYDRIERHLASLHKRRNELEAKVPKKEQGRILHLTEEIIQTKPRVYSFSPKGLINRTKAILGRARNEATTPSSTEQAAKVQIAQEPEARTPESQPDIESEQINLQPLEEALGVEGYDLNDLSFRSYEDLKRFRALLYEERFIKKYRKEILYLGLDALIETKKVQEGRKLSPKKMSQLKTELLVSGIKEVALSDDKIYFPGQPSKEELGKAYEVLGRWHAESPKNHGIEMYLGEVAAMLKDVEDKEAAAETEKLRAQEQIREKQEQTSKIRRAEDYIEECRKAMEGNLSVAELEDMIFKLKNRLWEKIPAYLASEINNLTDELEKEIENKKQPANELKVPTETQSIQENSTEDEEWSEADEQILNDLLEQIEKNNEIIRKAKIRLAEIATEISQLETIQ